MTVERRLAAVGPTLPVWQPRAAALGVITGVIALAVSSLWLGRSSIAARTPDAPPVLSRQVTPNVIELALDEEPAGLTILLYVTEECPYCREELQLWSEMHAPGRKGVPRIIIVSPSPLPASHRLPPAKLVTDTSGLLGRELGVRAVPSLFVVDATGTVIEARAGVSKPGRIKALLHGTTFHQHLP